MRCLRSSIALVLGFVGCTSRVASDGGGSESGSTGDACVVGHVACECTPGGGCDPGLHCIVGVCIPDELDTGTPDTGEVATSTPDSSSDVDSTLDSGPIDSSGDASSSNSSGSSSEGPPLDCGNGRLDVDEECDDGNTASGDGCNADCLPGGQEIWTVVIDGGLQADDQSRRIAIDADDDIYVSGVAYSQVLNDNDGFLIKLDDDGQVQWTERWDGNEGNSNDAYWGVAVLPDQSVVVAGWRDTAMNQREALVHAYSEDGDLLWTHYESDVGEAFAFDVAVDSAGDIVVAGNGYDDMSFAMAALVIKLTADGDVVWSDRIAVPTTQGAQAMDIDSNDAIAITGGNYGIGYVRKLDPDGQELWTWSDMLGGQPSFLGAAVGPDDDVFVAGITANGSQASMARYPADGGDPSWAVTWMGSLGGSAYAQGVAVDSSSRSVWVGPENGAGGYALYARKLDTDGEDVWTHEVAGLNTGYYDAGFGVAIDSLDQPVIAGHRREADPGDIDFWIRKLTQ